MAPATRPAAATAAVTLLLGDDTAAGPACLHWLPLGAGGAWSVRLGGRLYEVVAARRDRRPRRDVVHSALTIRAGGIGSART